MTKSGCTGIVGARRTCRQRILGVLNPEPWTWFWRGEGCTPLNGRCARPEQDVLAVCGADLPGWCGALVAGAPFLFAFALRVRWLHCTAFGLARALQHLQQLQAGWSSPWKLSTPNQGPKSMW